MIIFSLFILLSLQLQSSSSIDLGSLFGQYEKLTEEAKPKDVIVETETPVEYGVDVSFPMHYHGVSTNYPWLPHNADPENNPVPEKYVGMPIQPLGDRQGAYDDLLKGCRKHYGKQASACNSVENDRIAMSLRQPQSMKNYTETGYKKIRAPEAVFKLIKAFWDANRNTRKSEQWFTGNTYTNHWDSPTHMVSVEDTQLRGGGQGLKQAIWDAAKETMQEWTGEELTQCSLYGIRVYEEGAVLAHHVDRLPLVTSAIINVDQDTDEPWPIEVIGHDGKAVNVTMEPGDMVLYESHSVLHGRPFPLKGRFYANLFVHFEPTGHTLRHHGLDLGNPDVHAKYKKDIKNGIAGHENHNGIPSYLMEGTPEVANWKMTHPEAWRPTKKKEANFSTGSSDAHSAAKNGDIAALKKIAKKNKKELHKKDENGWQPIHEGARSGNKEVVSLLLQHGANINERTNYGIGGSVLYLAQTELGEDHPLVEFLKSFDAEYIEPEL